MFDLIRTEMKNHPRDGDSEIPVKIKVSGNDAAETCEQADSRGRHLETREQFGYSKSKRPVKINVESALHFARFVSSCDARMRRLHLLRHHQAVCFCNNAGTRVSSSIFSASSKSARVCLAVTHARQQILFCGTAGQS